MRRVKALKTKKKRSRFALGAIFAGILILGAWTLTLLALALLPYPSIYPHPLGRALEHLGQFGDAFAPVTALFAMIAAVGAWQSYEAQREQLNDERSRSRIERFDELFFRLLAYYDQQAGTVLWTSKNAHGEPRHHTVRHTIVEFRRYLEDAGGDFSTWDHDLYDEAGGFSELSRLVAQIVAIVGWLRSSAVEQNQDYAALLDAHLSDNELWFWQRSIAATGDAELISFAASSWKIYGASRGMTEDEAKVFKQLLASVDPVAPEVPKS